MNMNKVAEWWDTDSTPALQDVACSGSASSPATFVDMVGAGNATSRELYLTIQEDSWEMLSYLNH